MYPLLLSPIFKNYIWGGKKLSKIFGTDEKRIAEAWVLSCRDDGESVVQNSKYAGMPLSEVAQCNYNSFPVLVKLIDAEKNLSIQVHPNDEQAMKMGLSCGKTEMWYIIDCEPDAKILCGFKKDISRDEYISLIKTGGLLSVMNEIFVKPGDFIFVPAGTVHAICGGIFLAEVQQNSNTTFRVYDYDRTDENVQKRGLHIDEAVSVSNLSAFKNTENKKGILYECEYFSVCELNIDNKLSIQKEQKSFHHLLIISGTASIENEDGIVYAKKGSSILITSDNSDYTIKSTVKNPCHYLCTNF